MTNFLARRFQRLRFRFTFHLPFRWGRLRDPISPKQHTLFRQTISSALHGQQLRGRVNGRFHHEASAPDSH